jgi:hypothetical protein
MMAEVMMRSIIEVKMEKHSAPILLSYTGRHQDLQMPFYGFIW